MPLRACEPTCSCTPLSPPASNRPGRVSAEQVQRIALRFARAEIWPPRCCQHAFAAWERFAQPRGFARTRSDAASSATIHACACCAATTTSKVCPANSARADTVAALWLCDTTARKRDSSTTSLSEMTKLQSPLASHLLVHSWRMTCNPAFARCLY